jgi:hypothetical protein
MEMMTTEAASSPVASKLFVDSTVIVSSQLTVCKKHCQPLTLSGVLKYPQAVKSLFRGWSTSQIK